MTDHTVDVAAAMKDRDVELVMDFVVGELNQAGVEQLRRRIERDPAFRRLAENMIAAYQIPLFAEEAMDRAELLRAWDEFRMAGFTHQRRRVRWQRIRYAIVAVGALVAVAVMVRAPLARALWRAGFEPVTADTVRLADGSRVALDSGARLEVHERFIRDTARFVRLMGSARFTVAPSDSQPRLYVVTPAALVHTSAAEFSVRATTESTIVTGGAPGAIFGDLSSVAAAPVYLAALAGSRHAEQVFPGERAVVGRSGPVYKLSTPPVSIAVPPRVTPPAAARISSLREVSIDPARPLPGAGETVNFPKGMVARVDPDARVAITKAVPYSARTLEVEGEVLLVLPRDTAAAFDAPVYVKTAAGYVAIAPPLALSIVTRGDTTDVRVFTLAAKPRPVRDPWAGGGLAELYLPDLRVPVPRIQLTPGMSGRMVVGREPEKRQ